MPKVILPEILPLDPAKRKQLLWMFRQHGDQLWIGADFNTWRGDDLNFYGWILDLKPRMEHIDAEYAPVSVNAKVVDRWYLCDGKLCMLMLDEHGNTFS